MTKTDDRLQLFIFPIDQILKHYALKGYFHYTVNNGVAFGLFPGMGSWSIILYLVVGFLMWKFGNKWAFILFVNGALSNSLDRILRGGVVDYIPLFNYTNLADISIIASLIILSYHIITNQTAAT